MQKSELSLSARLQGAAGALEEVTAEYRRLDEATERLLAEREATIFAPWPKAIAIAAVEEQINGAREKFLSSLPSRLVDVTTPDSDNAGRKGLYARVKGLSVTDLICSRFRGGGDLHVDPHVLLGLLGPVVLDQLRTAIAAMQLSEPEGLPPAERQARLAEIDVELDRLEAEKCDLITMARGAGLSVEETTLLEPIATPQEEASHG